MTGSAAATAHAGAHGTPTVTRPPTVEAMSSTGRRPKRSPQKPPVQLPSSSPAPAAPTMRSAAGTGRPRGPVPEAVTPGAAREVAQQQAGARRSDDETGGSDREVARAGQVERQEQHQVTAGGAEKPPRGQHPHQAGYLTQAHRSVVPSIAS